MDQKEQYKQVFTDLIKKQMIMLGPSVALSTARKVAGVAISDDGTVTDITVDLNIALTSVAQAYMTLSGQIAQNTLNSILKKYPDIKQPADNA